MASMQFDPPAYPYTADELVDSGLRLGGDDLSRKILRAQRRCVALLQGPFAFQHEPSLDNGGREVKFEATGGSPRR